MKDFVFKNPAKIIFGRDALSHLAGEVKRYGKRVLLIYGGGSVKKIGAYDAVMSILGDIGCEVWELSGVVPNPRLSLVHEGVAICKRENIELILALGGGSVIDTAKAVANGAMYDGDEWDFQIGKALPEKVLPLGVILTLPAAGSEMSYSCVITNEDGWLKRGYNSLTNVPKFALLNPEYSFTLPPYQTACGCVDIMAHMMERYFTQERNVELTDGMIESNIRVVMRNALIVMDKPFDYDARAEIMWAGALAHNTLLQTGRVGDWCTHKLEHELSGMFDIAHGAGLAILFPIWLRHVMDVGLFKVKQFAVNVMGVSTDIGSDEQIALEGISRLEAFYKKLGMPLRLSEAGITVDKSKEMALKALPEEGATLGFFKSIDRREAEEIFREAL